MAGISSPGIGSNLDVNGIIEKLMQAEALPLQALAKKEASYQAKLSAYGTLSGALSAFQTAIGSLNTASTFQGLKATPGDSSIFTATATPSATAGSYAINVTRLAQAQTLTASGVASTTATIGTGTPIKLTFQFGTSGATFAQDPNTPSGEVIIDNTNNSLQGIRDAINKANIGVTASIVSDGSATPHRLVLTSNKTGEMSSMKIDVQGGEPALTNLLAYDPAGTQNMTQTSAAQDAALTVNGIEVTSQTNTVNGAIEGVTLNLAKTGSTNMTVVRNTEAVTSAMNGLVKAFNDLSTTFDNLTSYDPETKQAGMLLGDSSVRNIEASIRKMLSAPTTGSNSSLKTLSQVGISISSEGKMSLDQSKLTKAMDTNLADVASLFSSLGKTTDSLVSFVSASANTPPGTHDVFIEKLATQGKLAGSIAVTPTTLNSGNNELTVTVDGVTTTVSLVPRATPYSPSELASQVQSAVNGASALSSAGIAVSVTIDASGQMNITSNKYGSESKVSVTGSAAAALLGTPVATDGTDVKGTIGGVAASGSGQFLTGAIGSPASGLKLQITGGAENASRGSITFSQGYAFHLNNLMENFLGTEGLIAGRTDGIKSSIKDIGTQSERVNQRLVDVEKRYRAQFTALDVAISNMMSTSAFLTQQLAQLSTMSSQ
jgi:flagellar hook-associated protein 2